jgi:membrane-bound ClpP family serine protease
MNDRLTRGRLILAIISSGAEQTAIWAIWRWVLPEFDIRLPISVLIGVMVAWAAFSVWLFVFTTRTLRRQVPLGLPSMIGARGRAATSLDPEGMVRIRGELWGAASTGDKIDIGTEILVVSENGLKLIVRKIDDGGSKH